jgi:SRSO17 transposase
MMSFARDFSPFFRTATTHGAAHAKAYLCGLMQAERSRRNIERMAEKVPDLDYQGVQHFISESPWSADALITEVAQQADGLLGGATDSRLILDGSDFTKKGTHSVGVSRQYNGNLGKVDNCQAAVFSCLSAGRNGLPVGAKLYLPKAWCDDPSRCQKAGVPEDQRSFRTKTDLALELVSQARAQGLRYHYVCADGGFGSNPQLLRGLDDMGENFVIEVHCDQRLYRENPWPVCGPTVDGITPPATVKGYQSIRIDQWANALPDTSWERVEVRSSTGGTVEVNYVSERVWLWDGKEECARLWWALAWQNPDEGPKARIHYALSNAGADATVSELVKHGVHRYWIERTFQDGKSEAGMGDYQTRGWLGWHHHMALVMLAMLFLLKEKLLHQPDTGDLPLSVGEIVFVLSRLLPERPRDLAEVVKMIQLRREKRFTDQTRKREKTSRERPPIGPLEV